MRRIVCVFLLAALCATAVLVFWVVWDATGRTVPTARLVSASPHVPETWHFIWEPSRFWSDPMFVFLSVFVLGVSVLHFLSIRGDSIILILLLFLVAVPLGLAFSFPHGFVALFVAIAFVVIAYVIAVTALYCGFLLSCLLHG